MPHRFSKQNFSNFKQTLAGEDRENDKKKIDVNRKVEQSKIDRYTHTHTHYIYIYIYIYIGCDT